MITTSLILNLHKLPNHTNTLFLLHYIFSLVDITKVTGFWLVHGVRYVLCDCSVAKTLICAGFTFVWEVLYTENNVQCFCKDLLSLNLAFPLSDKIVSKYHLSVHKECCS